MKNPKSSPQKNLILCSLAFVFFESCLLLIAISLNHQAGTFLLLLSAGWFMWTFAEYVIHRFLMHELIVPGKKDELFKHHHHHQNPSELVVGWTHRLLIGVLGGLMMALAIVYDRYPFTILTGFFIGFLFYNFLHYLLHRPLGKYLLPKVQRAHILHHTRYPNCGYSFSTIFWDWLFDTLPPTEVEVSEQMKKNYFNPRMTVSKPCPNQSNWKAKGQITILALVVLTTVQSCVPVFSDLQSARTVGAGQVELTPFGTFNEGQNEFGANIAIGLSPNIDLRARYEYVSLGEGEGTGVFGIGPKFGIIPGRIAAFLPVGNALNEEYSANWQIQPTMLLTQPIVPDKLEATLSPKYLVYFCDSCGGLFATNVGLAWGTDLNKWAIRAEYGRAFSDGSVGQFSLGFSFNVNPKD